MSKSGLILAGGAITAAASGALALNRAVRWGATDEEVRRTLPGDDFLDGDNPRAAFTRATSIAAPPAVVWPWLAQLGRGAGWYSHDRLDNGGLPSANHIVSWIPEPQVGDASGIGWLRHYEPGRSLAWFMPGETQLGSVMRMVFSINLTEAGTGSRLVIRISCDATGASGLVILWAFRVIDSVMAIAQLHGIKRRAEAYGARTLDPDLPETGDKAQYQVFETVWASGESAGVPGQENASRWRQAAQAAGVLQREAGAGSPADESRAVDR